MDYNERRRIAGLALARRFIGVRIPTAPRFWKVRFLSMEDDITKNGLLFELGVFDLDGTGLRRDLRITARTIAALDRLRERGMRLVEAP